MKLDRIPTSLLIILLGCLLFIPFTDQVHLFDWYEIGDAESAREMLRTGNFLQVQMDYLPHWEKPPVFIWLQAISMKLFGVTEFAARFPSVLFSIASLLMLFLIGKRIYDKEYGVVWAIVYAGSILPVLFSKAAIVDPVFNFLIFLGIYFITTLTFETEFVDKKAIRRERNQSILLSGFFVGLAILTKGPVGIVIIAGLCAFYFILSRGKPMFGIQEMLLWMILILLMIFGWFGIELIENGPWFIREFTREQIRMFKNDEWMTRGPVYYHWIVLLLGGFPASIFMFTSLWKHEQDNISQNNFKRWMISLLIIVLIIYTFVQPKVLHYSSLALFPMTFLAAHFVRQLFNGYTSWKWYHSIATLTVGIFWAFIAFVFPLANRNMEVLKPYIDDGFVHGNFDASVYWFGWEPIIGLLYMSSILISVILVYVNRPRTAIFQLFIATSIFTMIVYGVFVPKIERFTQNAAISFYKEKKVEDCYINVLGYKSFAHLFYTRKEQSTEIQSGDINWLLNGEIDKVAYFVCKVDSVDYYLENYPLQELNRKNGYVFLKRK